MISTVNKYSLTLLVIILFSGNYFSQNYLDGQNEYATKLYEKKEYFDAITEYKRLLFFDQENKFSYSANLMIGKCYKGGAKLDEAIKYFSFANYNSKSDEEYYQSKIEIVKCNILRRTTDQAIVLLDELSGEKRFELKKNELDYWRGWSYIFADDWQKAAEIFNEINPNQPLIKLCMDVSEKKYSVAFVKILSFILPGSGQFYTGHYLSGLMSLTWTGLLAYVSINSFIVDRIFDGLITTGLFFRFHRGNLQNAEKFVLAENVQISNEMLKYLQEYYQGEKP
jgi:tetratricopeptide (TPR) repeat protein